MIVYILFFVILFLRYRKFKSPIVDFVLLFYLAASICGLLTNYYIEPDAYCTFFSVPFHCFCLFLFIYPILIYGKRERKQIFFLMSDKPFKLLSFVLIALQTFTILFFIGFVFNLLVRGDLSQIRSEMLAGDLDLGASLGRTIAGVASYYYCFNILLFFYSLAFRHDNKWFLILLMITSTSRIFHALTYMGRDGILFWIFSFVSTFFIFKPYLKQEHLKFVRRLFLIVGGFAIVLIAMISLSRFESSDEGVIGSLISYFGQPLNNFGQLFDKFHEYTGTKSIFPLLYGERGSSGSEAISNAESFLAKYGFASNIFFSFVGNMYKAWGPIFTIIFSLFYCVFLSRKVQSKRISMSTVVILMFATQLVLHNYFYWAYYIKVGNLYVLTLPLFVMYFKKFTGRTYITR